MSYLANRCTVSSAMSDINDTSFEAIVTIYGENLDELFSKVKVHYRRQGIRHRVISKLENIGLKLAFKRFSN